MLERLKLIFCDVSYHSRGMREWVSDCLPKFREQNPHVDIRVYCWRKQWPKAIGEYKNGKCKPVECKKKSVEEISRHVQWISNSHGRGMDYRVVRVRQITRNPSVQGPWNSDTYSVCFGYKQPEQEKWPE